VAPALRPELPLEPVRQPEFVRRADRAALWRRPAVRGLLALACLLLSALLVAQMAWRWRDAWAARFPVLRPALSAAAEALGQRLHSPRALERIVLDASDLGRTHTPGVLRLVADLRNTASHAVRAPALDVSFSDAEGVLLVRRVFLPTELGLASEELAAESSWAVDARVQVGKLRVAGYKIDVFYP
jgi:hypothetical protein